MKYVIIGGDNRFACLERLLKKRGDDVFRICGSATVREASAELGSADCIVMNHPVMGEGCGFTLDKVCIAAKRSARIYLAGPKAADLLDERIVDIWADETLKTDNAAYTAEGAIAAAMQASTKSIRECSCLVIGWGRIGKALTEMLVGMGVRVTVASRSVSSRNRAIERGAVAVNTDHLRISGFDIIFGTPPAMVLHDKILKKAEKDVMILDLASPPYGVDLKAAWENGLRAWREPGLPGRYCPESAAKAIIRAIDRAETGK